MSVANLFDPARAEYAAVGVNLDPYPYYEETVDENVDKFIWTAALGLLVQEPEAYGKRFLKKPCFFLCDR